MTEDAAPAPKSFADYEREFPDHELIQFRNQTLRLDGFPRGLKCLIAVPKAKIAAIVSKKGGQPPFWRHGDIMDVRPAKESHGDA